MASKRTLNARNLEALGAERLAELLVEVSTGNAGVKRRIRLELASLQSPDQVAKEIRKRLSTIARSRSFVDWQNRRDLVDDLEAPRRAIVQQVAKADPTEGLDLMWRFMALANSVFTRCDDSSGTVSSIFHAACHDLGEMAQTAGAEWRSLRDPVPAADVLAEKTPLAATLLLRSMIDFALKQNRVKRYRHAARHLAECASLAGGIRDFGGFEPHEHYTVRLKAEHGRKSSFWTLVT